MYCSKCGSNIENNSLFCPTCGTPATQPNPNTKNWNQSSGYSNPPKPRYSEEFARNRVNSNFICALAYVPILFWLPLVVEQNNTLGKRAANQGLWILIISIFASIANSFLHGIFHFTDGFIFGIIGGMLSGLSGFVFAMVRIALLVCMVVGFINTYKGEDFEIPLVGRIELIHSK